jgi:transposase
VDECGINEHVLREYGRAPRGVKVEDTKRGRKYHRINVVAAVIHSERGTKKMAPLCYHGSMNAERFEQWMTFNLIPALETGQTIIMDNASFHRKKQLEKICETAGVSIVFLPPYSPDFNPIEKDWSNMKRELRDTAPLEALLETAIYNYWC